MRDASSTARARCRSFAEVRDVSLDAGSMDRMHEVFKTVVVCFAIAPRSRCPSLPVDDVQLLGAASGCGASGLRHRFAENGSGVPTPDPHFSVETLFLRAQSVFHRSSASPTSSASSVHRGEQALVWYSISCAEVQAMRSSGRHRAWWDQVANGTHDLVPRGRSGALRRRPPQPLELSTCILAPDFLSRRRAGVRSGKARGLESSERRLRSNPWRAQTKSRGTISKLGLLAHSIWDNTPTTFHVCRANAACGAADFLRFRGEPENGQIINLVGMPCLSGIELSPFPRHPIPRSPPVCLAVVEELPFLYPFARATPRFSSHSAQFPCPVPRVDRKYSPLTARTNESSPNP